jgi:hypothetical protein
MVPLLPWQPVVPERFPSPGTMAVHGGTIIGLSGGPYTVTVTDENACTADQSIVVDEPAPVTIIAPIALPTSVLGLVRPALSSVVSEWW